eukprot:4855569-Lingulodinium_polyedra.AAC.1
MGWGAVPHRGEHQTTTCHLKAWEVLADFEGFCPAAVASLDDESPEMSLEDWAALTQAKECQRSCIRRFLSLEEGEVVANPKQHRAATHKILKGLDHGLLISTGRGLEGWVQAEAGLALLPEPAQEVARQHLSTVPRSLTLVADQAGSGIAAANFLTYHLGLSSILMMDPPHRFWNSEKLGLIQGDGWEVVSLLTVVFNINHGPWRSA